METAQVTAQSSPCSPAGRPGHRPPARARGSCGPLATLPPCPRAAPQQGPQPTGDRAHGAPSVLVPAEARKSRTHVLSFFWLFKSDRKGERNSSHERERHALLSAFESLRSDGHPHLHRCGAAGGRVWAPSGSRSQEEWGCQADSPVLKCTGTPRPRAGKEGPPSVPAQLACPTRSPWARDPRPALGVTVRASPGSCGSSLGTLKSGAQKQTSSRARGPRPGRCHRPGVCLHAAGQQACRVPRTGRGPRRAEDTPCIGRSGRTAMPSSSVTLGEAERAQVTTGRVQAAGLGAQGPSARPPHQEPGAPSRQQPSPYLRPPPSLPALPLLGTTLTSDPCPSPVPISPHGALLCGAGAEGPPAGSGSLVGQRAGGCAHGPGSPLRRAPGCG